ncbi:MAG: formyltransferase family protein [Sphingomonadales bacterium]|jgi:methionyl-tRNA formyltransferase
MPKKIILLAREREVPFLHDFTASLNKAVEVISATSMTRFQKEVRQGLDGVRLISFLSAFVVPQDVLKRLTLTPYNVHPGPPERPGLFPDAFAAIQGAREFGVTVHEMTCRVDAGLIVDVKRFALPPHATRLEIQDHAERFAVQLFAMLVRHCAFEDEDLKPNGEQWSGTCTTRQDYELLLEQYDCLRTPSDVSVLRSFRS